MPDIVISLTVGGDVAAANKLGVGDDAVRQIKTALAPFAQPGTDIVVAKR